MTTEMKVASAQDAEIQLGPQTYQQSMQHLRAVVTDKGTQSGVVILQPGQLNKVQVEVGKLYKLRKSANTDQVADDLVAVRHGDALHVRYADGSVVQFENFYTVCTDASVCSVNLASNSVEGATLSADNLNAGAVADDGLLVYAHGDTQTLMSMAQDQPGLSAALSSAADGPTLTYLAPSPYMGVGMLGLFAIGAASGGTSSSPTATVLVDPAIAEQARRPVRALSAIRDAAEKNTAVSSSLSVATYVDAGVNGVHAGNVDSINSALDTAYITGARADTASEVQAIVNAYNAILASADGKPDNTKPPLTGAQYAAIGVTGVDGSAAAGNAMYLLDNAVDRSATAAVNSASEVQAMATAANHVIDAAGGSVAQIASVTKADLESLGITGVTSDNLAAVRNAIGAKASDDSIDTVLELQGVVDGAIKDAKDALIKISNAAGNNTAANGGNGFTAVTKNDFVMAGVSGVTSGNLSSINKALDSVPVTADKADTTAELQAIVDAYTAILASADGKAGNTTVPIAGEQYAAIGVTAVPSGNPTDGSLLKLLDETVDLSKTSDVAAVTQLQAIADAATRVLAAAGGSSLDAAKLTLEDLKALGQSNVNSDNFIAARTAIQATTPDTAIDQQSELSAIVQSAIAGIPNALTKISNAADANNASGATGIAALSLVDYGKANVSGVTSSNVAAINSALDTVLVTADKANTTLEVQAIVDAYNAIEASADGKPDNTTPALTGAQYNAIGVTGVSGTASEGSPLYLLNNVVDQSLVSAVDTASEVQALATAALHVIGTASGGIDLTVADLGLLGVTGISGITNAQFAAIRGAIADTLDNGIQVDTQLELQAIADRFIASKMSIQSTLGGTTNLDVTSDLVLTVDRTVTKGTGHIHIKDLGGGSGFHGDTSNNSQDIDISTALGQSLVSIVGTGTNTKIIINPTWDLDLASNYEISFDDGVFIDSLGHGSAGIPAITFSTVAPGGHGVGTVLSDATASKVMNDSTGAMDSGRLWLDIEGVGNATGVMTQFGDLSKGAYALALKNYATVPGGPIGTEGGIDGMYAHDTNVGVTNFGIDDIVYFDSQANDLSKQKLDVGFVQMTDGGKVSGGLPGQNLMTLGATPDSQAGSAYVGLGLEGNTAKTIYLAVHAIDATPGWADFYHKGSEPLIMG